MKKKMETAVLLQLLLLTLVSSRSTNRETAVDLGTTLVALRFDNGVVVGADTRTSVGGTYVSHPSTYNKVMPVRNTVVLARSGSSAATQHLADLARRHVQSFAYDNNDSRSDGLTVTQLAHWLQRYVGSDGPTISLIVAGCDRNEESTPSSSGGGKIIVIAPSGASWAEEQYATAGSGSSYVVGFLDQELVTKIPPELDQERAVALCHQALSLAMARDGSSGGLCRIFVVTSNGIEQRTLAPQRKKQVNGNTIYDDNDNDNDDNNNNDNNLKGFAAPRASGTRESRWRFTHVQE